jgi:pilus assembly protein Flp/PilA
LNIFKRKYKKENAIMKHLFSRKNGKGQGLVEYALILVLVAIVVIGALMVLGPIIGNVFTGINTSLSGVGGGGGGGGGSPTAAPAPSGCQIKHADGYATGPTYPYPCYSPSLGHGYYP